MIPQTRLLTWQLRAQLAAGLSAMYAGEVPAYGTLVEVSEQVNSDYMARHPGTEALYEAPFPGGTPVNLTTCAGDDAVGAPPAYGGRSDVGARPQRVGSPLRRGVPPPACGGEERRS